MDFFHNSFLNYSCGTPSNSIYKPWSKGTYLVFLFKKFENVKIISLHLMFQSKIKQENSTILKKLLSAKMSIVIGALLL